MRVRWLLTLTVLLLPACTPLFDLDRREIDRGIELGVSVLTPSASRTVPQGTVVAIDWTASNLTDEIATVSVFVESRTDLTRTILVGGERIDAGTATRTAIWNTADFPGGSYSIRAEISSDSLRGEATAPGRITIDQRPEFAFAAPFVDTALPTDGGDDDFISIRWSGSDREGGATVRLSIDPDLDHDSGNEIEILERDLPDDAQVDSFDWNGNNSDNTRVASATYNLFAVIDDDVNPDLVVRGLAKLVVTDLPTALTTKIVEPDTDSDFLTSSATFRLDLTFNQDADVLIDLKMDTDDNHTNGNERTILQQRLIGKDTDRDGFDWNGTDVSGAALPDGLYRPVLVVDTGSGTPSTSQADGLIFRRAATDQPVIGVLEPATQQSVSAGSFVRIQWRDNDGSTDATVRLVYDDDATPNEAAETNAAETTILSNRLAKDDGVSDSFSFQVPASLAPGTYYVFAYVDRDGVTPFDCISIAPGRFQIPDPNN